MPRSLLAATAIVALLGTLVLGGCGGGGASTGEGTLRVYVMDGFADDYAQVWSTLYRVEVSQDGAAFRTIFDSTDGVELNLPELADSAEMLGSYTVPAGAYRQVRLTVRNQMRLQHRDGTGGEFPLQLSQSSGVRAGANGNCTVTFPVTVSVSNGQDTDLAVDFDLTGFSMVGGELRIRLQQGDRDRLQAMTKRVRFPGIVTNLGASGFDLELGNDRIVPVTMTDATVVISATTGADIALANRQRVLVFGSWETAVRSVAAHTIIVLDNIAGPPSTRPAHVQGQVTSVDDSAQSFTVKPRAAMAFRPQNPDVTVQTDAGTVFGMVPRAQAAFADVTVGAYVDVVGTYDTTAKALTAKRVLIRK